MFFQRCFFLGWVLTVLQQSSAVVLLNHTEVYLNSSINFQAGFSVSFRTCSIGNLVVQGNNDLVISLEQNFNISSHKVLKIEWAHPNKNVVYLSPTYSIDNNIGVNLTVSYNQSGLSFILVPDALQVSSLLPKVEKFIQNVVNYNSSGTLTIGSPQTYSCFSGLNLPQSSDCPLANHKECSGIYKKECPKGFSGRYCHIDEDDCAKNDYPCYNSKCVDLVNDYRCECGKRFKGKNCTIYLGSPCNDTICQNGGLCVEVDNFNDYVCKCTSHYAGRHCSEKPCSTNPCLNGTCIDDSTFGYTCQCTKGFIGRNCDVNINDCVNGRCFPGTCTDLVDGYKCNCNGTGYEGDDCDENINECEKFPNLCNNGTCFDLYGHSKYKCLCNSSFKGTHCTEDVDECSAKPCVNGTCTNLKSGYKCSCFHGYTGNNCNTSINDCGYCQNSERCIDGHIDYQCICKNGYTGKNCTENIDECASYEPCKNNGSCIDLVNDYNCSCTPSWKGKNCTVYQNPCMHNPCNNGGTCKNDTVNGYKCICDDDKPYGGVRCEKRIGACFPNDPCLNGGKCVDENGYSNYTCDCEKTGYRGRNCSENINECKENFPCKHGSCTDIPGSYICNCSTGYEGVNCDHDIDECNTIHLCVNGTCVNKAGYYECKCQDNYFGKYCENFHSACKQYHGDENNKDKPYCKNSGVCLDKNFHKKCECSGTGFSGDRCETNIDDCVNHACVNGTCEDRIKGYVCNCSFGFNGTNCSKNIDDCESKPCKNGACEDRVGDYFCKCEPGYEGKNCSDEIDWCANVTCENGGTCRSNLSNFTCDCFQGFVGILCEIDVDECERNPCRYHSNQSVEIVENNTCIEMSNLTAMEKYGLNLTTYNISKTTYDNRDGYICICEEGLFGERCQQNNDDCNNITCLGNSTCVDLIGDYMCQCVPGWIGKHCETDIDECENVTCSNNGTCIDLVNDFLCNCTARYTGKYCKDEKNHCTLYRPCNNGATCVPIGINDFICQCGPGFTGRYCDNDTSVNFDGTGYWKLERSIPSNISLWYKTVLPGTLLLFAGLRNLFVNISTSELLIWNGDNKYNHNFTDFLDGNWHYVILSFDNIGLKVTVDNITTEPMEIAPTNFTQLYVGGGADQLVDGIRNFTGCIRDLAIDSARFSVDEKAIVGTVVIGSCNRSLQCNATTCNGRGRCRDLWTSTSCVCSRQFYGEFCQFEMETFNFQARGSRNSTSRKRRSSDQNSYVSSSVDITLNEKNGFSLLVRTRQIKGFLAALLNGQQQYLLIQINNGFLEVRNLTDRLGISAEPINIGKWLEVVVTTSFFSINSSKRTFNNPLPDFQVKQVMLGSQPSVTNNTYPSFDGCLQAVKLGETYLNNNPIPGRSTNNVTLSGVRNDGCQGDKVCGDSPCKFNGTCYDLWNEYKCQCQIGFQGKTCSKYGCSVVNKCSGEYLCIDQPNKPGVTRCSKSLTYNGHNSSSIVQVQDIRNNSMQFTLRTRQQEALIMTTLNSSETFFRVTVEGGKIKFTSNFSSTLQHVTSTTRIDDGILHTISIKSNSTSAMLSIDSKNEMVDVKIFNGFFELFNNSNVQIGSYNSIAPSFQGCFSGFLLGGTSVNVTSNANSKNVIEGCVRSFNACASLPCYNGNCTENFNDFKCTCAPFYTKKTCNETINIDCSYGKNLCRNGTCRNEENSGGNVSQNGVDQFKCECNNGYEGVTCDKETNECDSNPCENGSECEDLHLAYKCVCDYGFSGKNCHYFTNQTCEKEPPCKNGGSCSANSTSYYCACRDGYSGKNCGERIGMSKTSKIDLPLIIGLSVTGAVILFIIIVIFVVKYCRDKSGMEGTYSPNKEEQTAGNVEMSTVKKPKPERLI